MPGKIAKFAMTAALAGVLFSDIHAQRRTQAQAQPQPQAHAQPRAQAQAQAPIGFPRPGMPVTTRPNGPGPREQGFMRSGHYRGPTVSRAVPRAGVVHNGFRNYGNRGSHVTVNAFIGQLGYYPGYSGYYTGYNGYYSRYFSGPFVQPFVGATIPPVSGGMSEFYSNSQSENDEVATEALKTQTKRDRKTVDDIRKRYNKVIDENQDELKKLRKKNEELKIELAEIKAYHDGFWARDRSHKSDINKVPPEFRRQYETETNKTNPSQAPPSAPPKTVQPYQESAPVPDEKVQGRDVNVAPAARAIPPYSMPNILCNELELRAVVENYVNRILQADGRGYSTMPGSRVREFDIYDGRGEIQGSVSYGPIFDAMKNPRSLSKLNTSEAMISISGQLRNMRINTSKLPVVYAPRGSCK